MLWNSLAIIQSDFWPFFDVLIGSTKLQVFFFFLFFFFIWHKKKIFWKFSAKYFWIQSSYIYKPSIWQKFSLNINPLEQTKNDSTKFRCMFILNFAALFSAPYSEKVRQFQNKHSFGLAPSSLSYIILALE